jgi:hypothetical protein
MKKILKRTFLFILALLTIHLVLDIIHSLHVVSYCDSGSIEDFIINETLDTDYESKNLDNKDVKALEYNTSPISTNLGFVDRIKRRVS